MTRIIVDESLRSKLQGLAEPVELCDPSGRLLGRYLPALDPQAYEGLESPLSRAELEKRKQSKGNTYSTTEVLAHLEKL